VPQFIDDDDKWRKRLLVDADEEGTGDFVKIDYPTQNYRMRHANEKLQDDSKGVRDGIGRADSAAPSKLEATSIVAGANDEARSIVPLGTIASIAPSMLESTSDALCANEAERPTISQCISQPTTTTTQLNDYRNNMDRSTDDVLLACNGEMKFDIENALAREEIDLTKETVTKEGIRPKVTWKVPCARYAYKPLETQDEKEAYRQYLLQGEFSISKVLPEQRPWIPADRWTTYPRKAHTRRRDRDEGRAKWKQGHLASRHMKDNAVFHRAQAERSALIMSLDVDVGTGTLPKKWPTIDQGPERFACGLCDLPPLEDKMTKRICYVNEPPARSLIPQATEIPVANTVNDLLAAQDGNTHAPDIQIPITSLQKDILIFPPYPSESADDLVKKAWAGFIHASVTPYKLRNQPDDCLIYRRIVQDTNHNNKISDDSYTMLYTEKYFSRELCSEPRQLEVTLFYCEHPQYFARELTEKAIAVTGVQVDRKNVGKYDFGIRRWLADAGCGYDLVQTSIVEYLGGQSLIRLRESKFLQTANGATSLHHEITMRIPQLDEFTEILRAKNTPSVVSIGGRCVAMGYCFHWPQYSENHSSSNRMERV
jgi:hypothetical protein